MLTVVAEPGETVATGSPLYTVADLSSLKLRAYATGDQLPRLRLGAPAEVLVDDGAGGLRSIRSEVVFIAAQAQFTPTPIQTRDERAGLVYAFDVRVPNPDGLLKVGMPGEVPLSHDARRARRPHRGTMTAAPATVEIDGLAKRFGRTEALGGVSLHVEPGELFGVIGPDGAGKSTLFRILVTVLLADAGTARLDGLDVVQDYREVRRRVGYMPGRFSLYPDLTVRENLEFFASVFGTTIEAEYTLIAPIYSQIEPFDDRPAGALSGGMKQKLALSCALVHRPRVLILDEPTTGVDAVSRAEFWDMLAELRSSGITTLVSTPYMDEAERCDRITLLQTGRLLRAPDTPRAVAQSFGRPLVRVRADGDRAALLAVLRATPDVAQADVFGEFIHVSGDATESAEALAGAALEALHDFQNVRAEPTDASVEDVFMALMGADEAPRPAPTGHAMTDSQHRGARRVGARPHAHVRRLHSRGRDLVRGCPRRGLRLPRRQRRRQDDGDEDADGPARTDVRRGAHGRPRRRPRARRRQASHRLHEPEVRALRRPHGP